jgi:hypothetical protein
MFDVFQGTLPLIPAQRHMHDERGIAATPIRFTPAIKPSSGPDNAQGIIPIAG